MNLQELKELIEQVEAEHDGDDDEFDLSLVEVRLATQPSYPFEYSVVTPDLLELHDVCSGCDPIQSNDHMYAVYLAERHQIGYLPRGLADELWY